MIHLPLKFKTSPPSKLTCHRSLVKLRKIVAKADGKLYSRTYYQDKSVTNLLRAFSIHKSVLTLEDRPKCYYCESQIEKAVTLQVEHYRPKAKVDEQDNGSVPHGGYYWLGHEWSNLLLSCPKCNGKSAKANRFPIRGGRALPLEPVCAKFTLDRTGCYADRGPLLAEDPLLLNPEIDYPEDFLTFNLNAEMYGHGKDAERGIVSKDVYNLNRPPLVADRLRVWDSFKNEILLDIGAHSIGRITEEMLLYSFEKVSTAIVKRKEASEEFTLWGRFINKEIESFIGSDISDDYYRRLFYQAYKAALSAR